MAKKLKPSQAQAEQKSQPMTHAQHAAEPLQKFIDSSKADKNTKAILNAMKLQTECIIKAIFESVEALKQNE